MASPFAFLLPIFSAFIFLCKRDGFFVADIETMRCVGLTGKFNAIFNG